MTHKPFYYDGSDLTLPEETNNKSAQQQNLRLTDEMRSNIGRNPYAVESED